MTIVTAKSGTLVVCFLMPERVYLAADSRYTHSETNTAKKAFLCGENAVCGISGNVKVELRKDNKTARFDLSEIAAKIGDEIAR